MFGAKILSLFVICGIILNHCDAVLLNYLAEACKVDCDDIPPGKPKFANVPRYCMLMMKSEVGCKKSLNPDRINNHTTAVGTALNTTLLNLQVKVTDLQNQTIKLKEIVERPTMGPASAGANGKVDGNFTRA